MVSISGVVEGCRIVVLCTLLSCHKFAMLCGGCVTVGQSLREHINVHVYVIIVTELLIFVYT